MDTKRRPPPRGVPQIEVALDREYRFGGYRHGDCRAQRRMAGRLADIYAQQQAQGAQPGAFPSRLRLVK